MIERVADVDGTWTEKRPHAGSAKIYKWKIIITYFSQPFFPPTPTLNNNRLGWAHLQANLVSWLNSSFQAVYRSAIVPVRGQNNDSNNTQLKGRFPILEHFGWTETKKLNLVVTTFAGDNGRECGFLFLTDQGWPVFLLLLLLLFFLLLDVPGFFCGPADIICIELHSTPFPSLKRPSWWEYSQSNEPVVRSN